jgi:hypothetical protein
MPGDEESKEDRRLALGERAPYPLGPDLEGSFRERIEARCESHAAGLIFLRSRGFEADLE